jgi:hypothetical protein
VSNVSRKISEFLFELEGDKKILRKRNVRVLGGLLVGLTAIIQIIKKEDSSSLDRSYQTLYHETPKHFRNAGFNERNQNQEYKLETDGNDRSQKKQGRNNGGTKLLRPKSIIYSAKQVIERGVDPLGLLSAIPSGTNFIGRLVGEVDSRSPGATVRVQLPYGLSHPKGGYIPKNSIIMGQTSASEGEKIFIRFAKVIFPSGEEFKIDAQALSSEDYSPGLKGIFHSNSDSRMFGSMALTVVSAAADVLTQRSFVNVGAMPSGITTGQIDASAKNAALQGVSQLSKEEAQRKMQTAQTAESYVTLESDQDLIISLLTPFTTEGANP